jgi:hypothetical protein
MIFIIKFDWSKRMNIKLDRILDRWFGGSLSFLNVTIYGRNGMKWGVSIHTKKWGYICFNLPIPIYGRIDKFYYYLSPNGTPWASTYYKFGNDRIDKRFAHMRKEAFGHNFDTDIHAEELTYINNNGELPQRILREITINDVLR